jgi:hypothetical protein
MKAFHLLMLAAGVPLLGLLIYNVGVAALWREFTRIGWGLAPLILLEGAGNLFHTQGWRHCLSGLHRSLPFGHVFCVHMAGVSMNYLTPTAGFGGEVTKGLLLASDRTGPQAASAVLLDKLSIAFAQLVFVTYGSFLFLADIAMSRALWFALTSVTALLGCGIIGFMEVQRRGKLGGIVRWAVRHRLGGASLRKAADSMTEVDAGLQHFFRTRLQDLLLSMIWHFVGFIWGVVPTYYFLILTRGDTSLSMAWALVVLGSWFDLISFAIPIDIGVKETTRVLAFRIVGFPAALGLTYGITRRLQQLFWAGIGLLLYSLLVSTRIYSFSRPHRDESGERPQ